jgi:hypothetical protein
METTYGRIIMKYYVIRLLNGMYLTNPRTEFQNSRWNPDKSKAMHIFKIGTVHSLLRLFRYSPSYRLKVTFEEHNEPPKQS